MNLIDELNLRRTGQNVRKKKTALLYLVLLHLMLLYLKVSAYSSKAFVAFAKLLAFAPQKISRAFLEVIFLNLLSQGRQIFERTKVEKRPFSYIT